ncbi:isocitrate lyase/phosphoenolpyruvate mutase family protein [Rhizobium sp. 2YAF20]|uniref:isocitrate lyase/PEP mutase family protein n=1 Tax=Rhizobium sp. 2YAF20 TaxID=3233027 RepID=UPI003F94F559
MEQANKAEDFARLHQKGNPLVLYNIWDAGSAGAVTKGGAKALATGSWSVAAAQGFGDGEALPLTLLADIVRLISRATDLPLTVDFEGGFALDPDDVAANVSMIADCGAVGINFEDQVIGGQGVHSIAAQSARIRAIRDMAERREMPFFVNARTDLFLKEKDATKHAALIDDAVLRASAYAAAGASGFFAPGLADADLIGKLCDRVTLPVNIMMFSGVPDRSTLASLGVGRISYGPGPYRAMIERLKNEAAEIYGTTAG